MGGWEGFCSGYAIILLAEEKGNSVVSRNQPTGRKKKEDVASDFRELLRYTVYCISSLYLRGVKAKHALTFFIYHVQSTDSDD